jgi:hypothetical protein
MDDGSGNDHASPMATDEEQYYDLSQRHAQLLSSLYLLASFVSTPTGYSDGEYEDSVGDADMIEHGEDDEAYRGSGFGAVPASAEAIEGLAKAAVEETTKEAECAVCMESFQEGDEIRKMPCSHGFHESCISQWLRISRVCPCCRYALDADEKWTQPTTEFEHSAAQHGYEDYFDAIVHDDNEVENDDYEEDEEEGEEEAGGYIYLHGNVN